MLILMHIIIPISILLNFCLLMNRSGAQRWKPQKIHNYHSIVFNFTGYRYNSDDLECQDM